MYGVRVDALVVIGKDRVVVGGALGCGGVRVGGSACGECGNAGGGIRSVEDGVDCPAVDANGLCVFVGGVGPGEND